MHTHTRQFCQMYDNYHNNPFNNWTMSGHIDCEILSQFPLLVPMLFSVYSFLFCEKEKEIHYEKLLNCTS